MRKMLRKLKLQLKQHLKQSERYVPYSIAVNGTSTPNLSDLKFTGDPRVGYKDITKKLNQY